MFDAIQIQKDKSPAFSADSAPKRQRIQDVKLTAQQLARLSSNHRREAQPLFDDKESRRSSSSREIIEGKPKKKKGKSKKRLQMVNEDVVEEAPHKKANKNNKARYKSQKKNLYVEAAQIQPIKSIPVLVIPEKQQTTFSSHRKVPGPVQPKEIAETICQLCYTIVANQRELYSHEMRCQGREMMCFDCKQSIPQMLLEAHQQCCVVYNERKQRETTMKSAYDNTKTLIESCVCHICRPVVAPPIYNPLIPNSGILTSSEHMMRHDSFTSAILGRGMQMQAFRNAYMNGNPLRAHMLASNSTIARSVTEPSLFQPSNRPDLLMPMIRECPLIRSYKALPAIVDYETYKNARQKCQLRQRILDNLPRRMYLPQQNEVDDCSICCAKMRLQDQIIELKCKHMIHIPCISEWLMKDDRCPLCMLKAI